MTETADKYISKSGRTAAYDRRTFTDDLLVAASFLYWAEGEYFGGHTGKEAFNAMCRMLDIDPIGLRKAICP
jgi:hypothetical protein